MLIIEVIALTLTGIAIYIQVVPAFWINIVVGIAHVIGAVYAFFDRYQFVFKNIYKVGSRIDKEGHWWKVFKNSCPSDAEEQSRPEHRKCEISCRLLRKIVQNELPFAHHAETSIRRLLSFLAIIILLGALTYFIEKETNTLFIGQYVLTVVPLTLLELRNLPRNPCSTKNKEDLHSQGLQRALKENLRKYAQTGEYPSASQQSRRSSVSPSNRPPDHGITDSGEGTEDRISDERSEGEPATRESATPQESTNGESAAEEREAGKRTNATRQNEAAEITTRESAAEESATPQESTNGESAAEESEAGKRTNATRQNEAGEITTRESAAEESARERVRSGRVRLRRVKPKSV
ncbi:uncharacterized protein [Diadema antillarum]|uniref:uncharacterized protein n=1 Tax=Diadema antillarum TaxID=105358 RepID=UPI003A861652